MPFWDTDYKKAALKSKAVQEAAEQRALRLNKKLLNIGKK